MARLLSAISIAPLLMLLGGCNSGPTEKTVAACAAYRTQLTLSDDDTARCTNDETYRRHLDDVMIARRLTEAHNADRAVLLPKAGAEGYARISHIADLPLNGNVEPATDAPAGQRFVIAGSVAGLFERHGREQRQLSSHFRLCGRRRRQRCQ